MSGEWFLFPGYAPSTDYLKSKYLFMMPPEIFCAILINVPRKNILKNFVPVSYNTELATIFTGDTLPPVNKCTSLLPKQEVSVFGAHISWDPSEIAKMINSFNNSLEEKYEGVCFFQPHGPGGLVSDDNLLVIHSYDTKYFGGDFSAITNPTKLFGIKVPSCTPYKYHFAIPIKDDDGNLAGGWVPPGDLFCYWDVTHEDSKQTRELFTHFLEKSKQLIDKYRHLAVYGNFPRATISPVIQTRAINATKSVDRWFRNNFQRLSRKRYLCELRDKIQEAANILKDDQRIEDVDWFEIPLTVQFKTKENEYFSPHTIMIEYGWLYVNLLGTPHGAKTFPGLEWDGEEKKKQYEMYFFDRTSSIYNHLALTEILPAVDEILECFHSPNDKILQILQTLRGGNNEN